MAKATHEYVTTATLRELDWALQGMGLFKPSIC